MNNGQMSWENQGNNALIQHLPNIRLIRLANGKLLISNQ